MRVNNSKMSFALFQKMTFLSSNQSSLWFRNDSLAEKNDTPYAACQKNDNHLSKKWQHGSHLTWIVFYFSSKTRQKMILKALTWHGTMTQSMSGESHVVIFLTNGNHFCDKQHMTCQQTRQRPLVLKSFFWKPPKSFYYVNAHLKAWVRVRVT